MRVFVTRWFDKFARRERMSMASLCKAIQRAEDGLIDADLGGGLIKQRVARQGQGMSGGYRTLIAFRSGDRAVFLYGFAKSERDNVEPDDLADLKRTAGLFLVFTKTELARTVAAGELKELMCNG